MTLLSLTAYAATHGVRKQSAAEWKAKGYLVMSGALIDAEASDARMEGAGKGRFRVKAHGGRRFSGVRGLIDRPGAGYTASQPDSEAPEEASDAEPHPWQGWHPVDNPHTLAATLRDAIESGDPDDMEEALDLADFASWDDACKDAGWDRWPSDIAAQLAADLGITDRADDVQDALHRRVRERLASLDAHEADLTDPRLKPR